jgi:ribonuclease HII
MNLLQSHDYEQLAAYEWLIGVDEAGRGCLAGPVTAAACLLGRKFFTSAEAVELSSAINDSKQLSANVRTTQFAVINNLRDQGLLDFEVASSSVEEIEALNILGATRLAMRRAVEGLAIRASGLELPTSATEGPLFPAASRLCILVDGRPLKPFPYAHTGLIKGDGKSLAIAIASIAAKVVRDREMNKLAEVYPEYFFEKHKGYGTALHRAALRKHGVLTIHRKLFLRKILSSSF